MEQNLKKIENKGFNFIKVSIVFAIVIVMNMFFNYGVSLVYNEPSYNDYVKDNQVVNVILTQADCVNIGGQWSENSFPGEKGQLKIEGYCNENYTNQINYNLDINKFEKKVFITLISLGVFSLIIAGFISTAILSMSFAWGGVLSLIIASTRYWSQADDFVKVIILGIALGILIWLAVKKFNK